MGKSSRAKRTTAGAPTTRPQSATTSRPLNQAAKPAGATAGTPSQSASGVAKPMNGAASDTKPAATVSKPITRPTSGTAANTKPTTRPTSSAVGGRSALATTRATYSGKGAERRRQRALQQQRKRWMPIAFTLGGIVFAILVFFVIAKLTDTTPAGTGQLAPTDVVNGVTGVSADTFNKVGTGGQAMGFKATPPNTPIIKNGGGLPIFFYAGAEYCPYCAAERWSMITALSRFGTFHNLHLTTSASDDVYPNTNTFTFVGSTYTSKYIDFQPVEMQDRNRQTLQSLNSQQNQWFTTYDAPPYVSSADQSGSFPFLSIANQYIQIGTGYDPQLLAGLTWQQIAADLSNPNSPVAKAILGNANYLTAAICKVTNNQPSNVCTSSTIQSIEQQLPKGS